MIEKNKPHGEAETVQLEIESSSDASEPVMTTHRIEALADGIFAIAMTLLVLTLAFPEITAVRGLCSAAPL